MPIRDICFQRNRYRRKIEVVTIVNTKHKRKITVFYTVQLIAIVNINLIRCQVYTQSNGRLSPLKSTEFVSQRGTTLTKPFPLVSDDG
jgi:hypothetical protein